MVGGINAGVVGTEFRGGGLHEIRRAISENGVAVTEGGGNTRQP